MSLVLEKQLFSGVWELVLNRPEKLNAFSAELVSDLTAVLKKIKSNPELRCLILRSSTPKAFAAGADLKERLAMSEAEVVTTIEKLNLMVNLVDSIEVPTIAVIEGIAFGGGLELALAVDFRLFSLSAKVGLTETSLGIIPGAGGTQRLSRLIGISRAQEMICFAKSIDAPTALQWSLCHWVGESPYEEAKQWAQKISASAPLAQRAAKKAIKEGLQKTSLSDALVVEKSCYQTVLKSQDRVEGLKAFQEKRSPNFKGN